MSREMKPARPAASKPVYVALLRGINISGHNIVKMDQLRDGFEGLGFEDVQSYVQSGNVVFKTAEQATEKLSKTIESMVLRRFQISVRVMVKTSEEIGQAIKNNPFLQEKGIDLTRLYVTFLSCAAESTAVKKLEAIAATPDQLRCCGQEVYLHCPIGYGRSKLSNNLVEKVLSVSATTRNWNTVNKLREMCLG